MSCISKKRFFNQRSLGKKLCDARILLNRKRFFRNEPLLEKVIESDFIMVPEILNDLEENGLLSGWIVGGETAVMYYSDVVPTVDIDVFARYAAPSFLAPLSKVYEYLFAKYHAKIEAEMIRIGGIYLQFLPVDSNNPVDAEAARHPNSIPSGLRLFQLEYLICSMLYVGSKKYLPRLAFIKAENMYDAVKLSGLLLKFGLGERWEKI